MLRWVDENGNNQSYTFTPAATGSTSGCVQIYHQYTSAPTIETDGTYSEAYNLFVTGFGFWNVSPQKQGGLTEPISADYAAQTSLIDGTDLGSSGYSEDLVVLTLTGESNAENITASLQWYDDAGAQLATVSIVPNAEVAQLVLPIREVPDFYLVLSTTGTVSTGYDLHVRGVQFGTPATGSGPLTSSYFAVSGWDTPLGGVTGFTIPAGAVALGTGSVRQGAIGDDPIDAGGTYFPEMSSFNAEDTAQSVGAAYFGSAYDLYLYAPCSASPCGAPYDFEFFAVEF